MAHRLEEYDAYWFEEPVSPDNISGSAEVAASSDVPIATGENEYTRWGFRDLIEARAADIINADAQVLGGITEFRKAADLASAYEIPGTVIFDGRQAMKGYALNKMCFSFHEAANREEFKRDEEAYFDKFNLNEEQREAVRQRNALALIAAGGNMIENIA